jgi:site-specific recombinase XerD
MESRSSGLQGQGVKPMNPHLLRHACAALTCSTMGHPWRHARISTTAGYAFVSTALMHRTYNGAHPHAKR